MKVFSSGMDERLQEKMPAAKTAKKKVDEAAKVEEVAPESQIETEKDEAEVKE